MSGREAECCVCFEKTENKVCGSNHMVCKDCLDQIKTLNCPMCRQEMNLDSKILLKVKKNIEREKKIEFLREKIFFVREVLKKIIFKYGISLDNIPDKIVIPEHYSETQVYIQVFESIKKFALDPNFSLKKELGTLIVVHDSENYLKEDFL